MRRLIGIVLLTVTVGTPALAEPYETGNRHRRRRVSIHERDISVNSLMPCRRAAVFMADTSTTMIPGEAVRATISC